MRSNQVDRLLVDEVTITPRSGIDAFGQRVDGTAVTVKAKVAESTVRARDAVTGEDFVSTTQVVVLRDVRAGDLVTFAGVARDVRSVRRVAGVRGGVALTVALL